MVCSTFSFRFDFAKLLRNSPIEIKVIIPEMAYPMLASTVSAMKNPMNPDTKVAVVHNKALLKTFLVNKATTMPTTSPRSNPPKVKLRLTFQNLYLANILIIDPIEEAPPL